MRKTVIKGVFDTIQSNEWEDLNVNGHHEKVINYKD